MAKSADAFRTISEVADWLETPAHVLRFWESKFSHVKPVKRAGGRRYYRPADMLLLGGIKKLLHDEGMTIKGVQKILREKGVKHVAGFSQVLDDASDVEESNIALDVTPEPETETKVVNIRARGDTSARPSVPPPAEGQPVTADTGSDGQGPESDEAQGEEADAPVATTPAPAEPADHAPDTKGAEAETEEPDQADEPDPELPSFAHRHGVAPQAKAPAEPAEDVDSRKIPSAVTVPDDMDDDVEAEPGLLTQIVALPRPVLAKHAASLAPIAERLKALGNGDSGHKND